MTNTIPTPTDDEVRDYMERHNADEAGEGNQWTMDEARHQLEHDDAWYYKRKAWTATQDAINHLELLRDALADETLPSMIYDEDQLEEAGRVQNTIYEIKSLYNHIEKIL